MARALGFYGFGEAGSTLARDLRRLHPDRERWVYDVDAARAQRVAEELGCRFAESAQQLADRCPFILSLVPGSEAVAAASVIAPALTPGHIYVDGNSVSPVVKQQILQVLSSSGAKTIDAAVMGSVPENGLCVAILVSGDEASKVADLMNGMGFRVRYAGDAVGQASAIKMIRSVFTKGLEALFIEMLLGARRYGVEDAVIDSVAASLERKPFRSVMNTLVVSQARHSARKASEMKEVAETLSAAGIPAVMSEASRRVFLWLNGLGLFAGSEADDDLDYLHVLDALDAATKRRR